jgi:uncharacterized protein YdeI (YjbR/CyaY-like superfamily)
VAIDREHHFFEDRAGLRTWLANNHTRKDGVWAVFYKKSTGLSDMSWEALVEECLCFGWIDSLPGKVDDQKTKIYISPRKTNSGWSRRNKVLLIELEAKGIIEQPGIEVIERAKSNGSWERFDLSEDLVIPAELAHALESDAAFAIGWAGLTDARKRQYLQQIYDGKTLETRNKRIQSIRDSLLS